MTRLIARSALVAACAFAAPVAAHAQSASTPAAAAAAQPAAKTPNLTGTWELNLARSKFGEQGAPTKGTMVVTQTGDKITRLQSISSPMGEMKNTMHHAIGSATTDTVQMAGQPMAFTSTARWEGSTLVVDGRVAVQGMEIPVLARFTLSPDGKQLMVDQTVSTPMGEQVTHVVYDKKG